MFRSFDIPRLSRPKVCRPRRASSSISQAFYRPLYASARGYNFKARDHLTIYREIFSSSKSIINVRSCLSKI